jgi:hypothetical protein
MRNYTFLNKAFRKPHMKLQLQFLVRRICTPYYSLSSPTIFNIFWFWRGYKVNLYNNTGCVHSTLTMMWVLPEIATIVWLVNSSEDFLGECRSASQWKRGKEVSFASYAQANIHSTVVSFTISLIFQMVCRNTLCTPMWLMSPQKKRNTCYFLIDLFQPQLRDYLFIYFPIDVFMKPISIVLLLFIFLLFAV